MLGWIVNALVRDNNNARKVSMPGLLDRYRELPFDELRKLRDQTGATASFNL